MIKRVFVKSSMCGGETEAQFFNDKEWKIVLNCESMGDFGESNVDSNDSRIDSSDFGESSAESSADSQITITFFALENDIDDLVCGYLATFLEFNFANLRRENNSIFVDSHLSKDEILLRLSQKDIIQSCEQISLSDKKMTRDSLIMPFNGSRAKITREILEANRGFFQNGDLPLARHSEGAKRPKNPRIKSEFILDSSLHTSCYAQNDEYEADFSKSSNFPHKARILLGKSYESNAESFDTNPKNAIYKAIGKAFDYQANGKQITSLLDSVIFLNFRADIECLKILILQKCTFIVCAGIPSFSVVRFAQKFGITLIAFTNNDFLVLTHALRFQA